MKHKLIHKYKWQERAFNLTIFIFYVIMIMSAFGLSKYVPTYMTNMDYYVKVYVCLFLIWRFNPLRTSYELSYLDRKTAFSAGLFILTTTVLNEHLDKFNYLVDKINIFGIGKK